MQLTKLTQSPPDSRDEIEFQLENAIFPKLQTFFREQNPFGIILFKENSFGNCTIRIQIGLDWNSNLKINFSLRNLGQLAEVQRKTWASVKLFVSSNPRNLHTIDPYTLQNNWQHTTDSPRDVPSRRTTVFVWTSRNFHISIDQCFVANRTLEDERH